MLTSLGIGALALIAHIMMLCSEREEHGSTAAGPALPLDQGLNYVLPMMGGCRAQEPAACDGALKPKT